MSETYDMGIPHPATPYPKLMINAAITGMVPKKSDTPHIPITVEEIVEDSIKCCRAGASIIHLHARDENGEPTYQKELYARMIKAIRQECPDLIICATTSGRVHNTLEKRSDVLDLEGELKPDMASLTMGSLNFPKQASVNTPDMIQSLALKMKERGIIPEIEIFELGMINAVKVLIKNGILTAPFYANLLLGSLYSVPATVSDLGHMVQSLPQDVTWAATGIGKFQLKINIASVLMGGHVRVGLEDNIFYDNDKRVLATNEMLIQRVVRIASELGREVASPQEAREILGFTRRAKYE
ncbi:MAG TPA: 3-keto-5-aminohexanoate cleavage protein [Candidatus Omnitrophota bacterium]|nr:3-keto-5-aminohexanoate cleavage protein [Candidatus Omnitrophota bacterium]